jgi:hypothetical protein
MNPAEPTNPADLAPVQEGDLEDCDSLGGDASDQFIRGVSVPQKDLAEDELQSIRRADGLTESRLMDSAGETIEHILDRFRHEVRNFEQGGDLDNDLYDALFDYYAHSGDMPYGVQKARDGDPMEWVAQNLESHLRGGGIVGSNPEEDPHLERESVMHGDYAEEAREPHSVDGGMDNPLIQDESEDMSVFDDATCNMTEAGETCPVHGVQECWGSDDTSPLAGQYGHSGKLKAVDKNLSFLDRLKELSGLSK